MKICAIHGASTLTMGNVWREPLSSLLNTYDPEVHPVCGPILKGGPAELARRYAPDHTGRYVDACHLCTSVCAGLLDRFPHCLAPRQVYGRE